MVVKNLNKMYKIKRYIQINIKHEVYNTSIDGCAAVDFRKDTEYKITINCSS